MIPSPATGAASVGDWALHLTGWQASLAAAAFGATQYLAMRARRCYYA
jgi:hypothetical protein